jgi:TRAP transporter TAXI family solute receptor
MKKSLLALAVLSLQLGAASAVGIASGQPTGTNYPMAEDIIKVCSKPDAPITNVVSDGSIDNLNKVYQDPTAQFGIVQADAAKYQQGVDPQMMKKIVMVFPFFSTEIHLVAKDGSPINSLADLAGKRVVEGPEGSGTWVTVQVIKQLTGLKWQGFYASQAEGTKAVASGQADAEFIVAGAPVKIIKDTAGLKLVSIKDSKLDAFGLYTKAMLSTSLYPSQKAAVNTYKVDNMLVTFAFKTERQKEIGDLVTCITRNVEKMQTTAGFHPKWRDVSPTDIERIQWPAHPAAVAAIKKELRK